MYTDGRRHIHRVSVPPSPARPFRFPLARSSSSHTRARTNATRERRTHARTRAGIFFFPFDIVMSTLTGTRRELGLDRERSPSVRAGTRCGCSGTRATATQNAETREGARGMCGMFFGGGSRSRPSIVASSSRGRRADDDGPAGRRRRVDRVNRRGCQSELFAHMDLRLGCGRF